jgi:GalNAc5-diNAcBac-PP-undecaprenol beta-1,3-glucosyltransferase
MSTRSPSLRATILVPTTGDRGPLLPISVGSILSQNVREIEVFIMGDGVSDATRSAILKIAAQDSRVRFFDHPKDERRGEPHRHAALAEARGEIVCYLTDRDIMLPNHVEVIYRLLQKADFGHTLRFGIAATGGFSFSHTLDIDDTRDRAVAISTSEPLIPLPFAGHTLSIYRRLPYGWRTAPTGEYTDRYMWKQFLAQPECRTATSTVPTILYFKRGAHPGWSVEKRLAELSHWYSNIGDREWLAAFSESVRDAAIRDRARLARQVEEMSLLKIIAKRFFPA